MLLACMLDWESRAGRSQLEDDTLACIIISVAGFVTALDISDNGPV
jgi:hypothetical protein